MPEKFREWFKETYATNLVSLWDSDKKDKDLIAGAMARYLLEHGQQIGGIKTFTSFDDYFNWLRTGVEWTS